MLGRKHLSIDSDFDNFIALFCAMVTYAGIWDLKPAYYLRKAA